MASSVQVLEKTIQWTPELEAFCARHGITQYVPIAVATVEKTFAVCNGLTVYEESDPETGEAWLVLDIYVKGTPEETLDQYSRYTREIVEAVPWPEAAKIRLSFHPEP